MDSSFNKLVKEATDWSLTGWNFQLFKDRWVETSPTWDYATIVSNRLVNSKALLDMGTGGGEFLSSLDRLPEVVCATEGFKDNIPIAKDRLEPLGIKVFEYSSDSELPFEDEQFDLIINRHESFEPSEILRILKPDGTFLTQQVGGKDNIQLNQLLDGSSDHEYHDWCLSTAIEGLNDLGFILQGSEEEFPETVFTDIGAVVVFLRAIPWQIPNFSVDSYAEKLFELHKKIQTEGRLVVSSHRFYFEVRKPA